MPEPKFGPENTVDAIGLVHEVSQFSLGKGVKTATATAGAATLHQPSGRITTQALTTALNAIETITLTCNKVATTDIVQACVVGGTYTTGLPFVASATPGPGADTIVFRLGNGATAAVNGTVIIGYEIIKV